MLQGAAWSERAGQWARPSQAHLSWKMGQAGSSHSSKKVQPPQLLTHPLTQRGESSLCSSVALMSAVESCLQLSEL